jgi:phosphoglycolate phosphatase
MIRAIAFDLDGTLIDTAPDLGASANLMLARLGRAPLPQSSISRLIGAGISAFVERVLEETAEDHSSSPIMRAGAEALFRRLYRDHLFERGRIYPEVRATLKSLADGGTALCCVTNKESAFTPHLLTAAHLDSYFQHVLCADYIEDRKPSPNLLLQACKRVGVKASELLYVGDSRADIIAARAAGCRIAAVSYGYEDAQTLLQMHPDEMIESLREVTQLTGKLCALAS